MTALALVTTAEPEPLELPERISMSFAQDAMRCLRMADLKRKADTSGEDATVGTAVHSVGALAGMRAARLGVDRLSADELERLAREVLRTPDDGVKPLSLDGWRTVIRLSRRLAHVYDEGPPPFPIGAEYEVYATRPLDGHTISSRVDWRWIEPGGRVCWIKDYKAGKGYAASDLTFQGEVYAWQTLATYPAVDTFWIAQHALQYGRPRWVWMDAADLSGPGSIEEYLSDIVARMVVAYSTPPLPAQRGSWCSYCPDRPGCPLPKWAKGAPVASQDDAIQALDTVIGNRADTAGLVKTLRAYVDHNEATRVVSGDMEIGYTDDGKFAVRKAK